MNIFSKVITRVRTKRFSAFLSLAIGIFAFYLALKNVDVVQVWETLRQANLIYVLLAIGSVALNAFGKAARWRILLGDKKHSLSFLRLFEILIVGQMLNNLFPARLGDLGRAYVAGGRKTNQPSRSFVFGTVVVEKIVDLFFYLLIFAFVIILIPDKAWMIDSIYSLVVVAVIAIITFGVVANYPDQTTKLLKIILALFPRKIFEVVFPRIRSGLQSMKVIKNRGDLLKIILYSMVVWGTAILNNYLAMLALQIYLPLTASLLVLVGLQAGISLPSVPGWIGIFEYICVVSLDLFGIEQNIAFGYGLLLHGVVLGPAILAGVIFLWKLGGVGEFLDAKETEITS